VAGFELHNNEKFVIFFFNAGNLFKKNTVGYAYTFHISLFTVSFHSKANAPNNDTVSLTKNLTNINILVTYYSNVPPIRISCTLLLTAHKIQAAWP
jgi:hypothetical protein